MPQVAIAPSTMPSTMPPNGPRLRVVNGVLPDGTAHFAPIGVVVTDDTHMVCHLCGGWYRSVRAHLVRHGWTAEQYRDAFGLERCQSLEGPATRRRRAAALTRRRATDPAIVSGAAIGQQLLRSGALTAAAVAATTGRHHPEQRRRKARAAAATTVAARAAGTRRHATRVLTERVAAAAARCGFPDHRAWVRSRLAAGAGLAAISREAGLHEDWLCRHLATVDPAFAVEIAGSHTARWDARWLPRVRALGFPDVHAYLQDRHGRRHLTMAAIGAEIGIDAAAVRTAMTRHGISPRPFATTRLRLAERSHAVARRFGHPTLHSYLDDRRAAGMAWAAIATECGQPQTWLRRRWAER